MRKKETSSMSNGKNMIIHLIARLIKKTQYFPKPYEPFGGDISVKFDLSNYATKPEKVYHMLTLVVFN